MAETRISSFEIVLLIVSVTTGILGFQLINRVYTTEGIISWPMVIAIFVWLILIVLFISLSLAVDVTKKQLAEIKKMVALLEQKKGKK